jgi:hypothetical protein
MQSGVWVHLVLVFLIGCHGVLLWRLWSQKLLRSYLFFSVFLLAEVLQDVVLLPMRSPSTRYSWTYVISTPVIWLLAYFVVLELYRLIFEDYPGIASVSRKAVTWCMALAVVVSFLYAVPDLRSTTGPFPILRIYYILERSMVLALLLFLVLVQLFLIRYRLRLSSNRTAYATGYALYFGITVAQDVIFTSLGIKVVDKVGLWTNVAGGVVLLAGAAVLTSKGEERVQLEAVDSSSERVRLQQQLSDINRLLSRAARGGG